MGATRVLGRTLVLWGWQVEGGGRGRVSGRFGRGGEVPLTVDVGVPLATGFTSKAVSGGR